MSVSILQLLRHYTTYGPNEEQEYTFSVVGKDGKILEFSGKIENWQYSFYSTNKLYETLCFKVNQNKQRIANVTLIMEYLGRLGGGRREIIEQQPFDVCSSNIYFITPFLI